eukprot:CAMPEP_0119326150 /NCGR_PEP_ID=MMETSP1333-20130426/67629_1 /TAXON_ID=418940 /ORGANISM="Scyphosphaera apsteinii, Strain RCC1455" /LENGTH=61 /DNA_ID=CAMNT_0007334371 /DNA_START=50 /DNA_END=233 /DNA_ORIENTATION=-
MTIVGTYAGKESPVVAQGDPNRAVRASLHDDLVGALSWLKHAFWWLGKVHEQEPALALDRP